MQNKNMLVFMVVCAVILFGYSGLQNWLHPHKKPETPKKSEVAARPLTPAAEEAVMTEFFRIGHPVPTGDGADLFRFVLNQQAFVMAKPADEPPVKAASWPLLKPAVQQELKTALWQIGQGALAGDAGDLFRIQFNQAAYAILKPDVAPFTLGGPKHHIVATLTPKGAGVQKLVLNKFKQANWLGRPAVPEADLALIPDDPFMASFLMYDYEDPENKKIDEKHNRPTFTLAERVWKLEETSKPEDDDQFATFSIDLPERQLRIVKKFGLEPHAYHLDLSIKIINLKANEPNVYRYQLTGAHGLPIEGDWYTSTFRTSVIGMVDAGNSPVRYQEDSAAISHRAGGTRVPEKKITETDSYLQFAGVMNQYFASVIAVSDDQKAGKGIDALNFLAWARPTLEEGLVDFKRESLELRGAIVSKADDMLTVITPEKRLILFKMLPSVSRHLVEAKLEERDGIVVNYYEDGKGERIATWARRGSKDRPQLDDITVRVQSILLNFQPKETKEHRYVLYQGPSKVSLLYQFRGDESVKESLVERYNNTLNLRQLTDFGRFYWWSTLLNWCSSLMHWLLNHLIALVGNKGLCIILLTALVRGLMFPISRRQARFTAKMAELAPEMKKLQDKHKDDPRAQFQAMNELKAKHGVSTLAGCLPTLLQMPIFIGLYFALQESIHFRLASFLWMKNLAAPDMLIEWGDKIPMISDPDAHGGFFSFLYLGPFFNLLPVIAVTLMIIQQKIMTPPPQDEQQAAQYKMMRYMMVFIGLMFYKVASGLSMYIIVSTLWGLIERKLLPKKLLNTAPTATASAPAAGPKPGASGRKVPAKPAPVKTNGKMGKVKDWWQDVLKQARKK